MKKIFGRKCAESRRSFSARNKPIAELLRLDIRDYKEGDVSHGMLLVLGLEEIGRLVSMMLVSDL
jgi:hypothetical protein